MAWKKPALLSLLFPCTAFITYHRLKREGTAATLNRLFTSNHVLELRLIASATVFVTIISASIAAVLQYAAHETELGNAWSVIFLAKFALPYLIYVGPILAVCGIIIAWVYQQASARLGIVDLFAGEITTLCRVGTIMDIAKELACNPDRKPPATSTTATEQGAAGTFESQEEYFPIFHNSAKDLQVLEAKVVIHITSFYTYMKVMRDLLRRLRQTPHFLSDGQKNEEVETARCNTIYMLFLAFESARKAVRDLVEYQPKNAECTVTILLTELKCYAFLLKHFAAANDMRYRRLDLRRVRYEHTIAKVLEDIAIGIGEVHAVVAKTKSGAAKAKAADLEKDWQKAFQLIAELRTRYEEAGLEPKVLEPHQRVRFWFELKKFVRSLCGLREVEKIKTPYVAAAYLPYVQPGSASIVGTVADRQLAGRSMTCAGMDAELIPATAYTRESIAIVRTRKIPSGRASSKSRTLQSVTKKAKCDSSGHFAFNGLAAGTWIVGIELREGAGDSMTGAVFREISVAPGETATLTFADTDFTPR